MRKGIGKWLMDIAKYVATAVLISSFLGECEEKWIMYALGLFTVTVSFSAGLFFIKERKED